MSSQASTPQRSAFPVIVAIIGVFLLFWFLASEIYVSEPAAAPAAPRDIPSLAERQGEAQSLLGQYKVLDASAGTVRLPIERAKELIVAENAK